MRLFMKFVLACFLFLWLSASTATTQVLPKSDGSCSVSASGVYACNWMSAPPNQKTDGNGRINPPADERTQLFVTRFVLAEGASLRPLVEGHDVLIFGINDGELINEKKSPATHINVRNGLVFLMPKDEPYLLRNVGKQSVELLVVEMRKVGP
jgi:mannose-6-phosphate isomerase-like protein (cupin superfamily)